MRSRLPFVTAILAVSAVYGYFASAHTFRFRSVAWDEKFTAPAEGYYASLAEGYRRGQLSMAHEPDPRLKATHDPYNPDARKKFNAPYLWDASYYHGKYYLYFSSLPVLLFYLPFRLIRGAYPLDALAGFFFSTWAFVIAALTLRRAFKGRTLSLPLPLWILLIGLGNVIAFTLTYVRTYEVTILCAMAMSATWAYALLRFTEEPSAKHATWMGIALALAIMARPNLIVILLTIPFVIPFRNRRAWIGFLLPIAIVGLANMAHNYRRFGKITELGWHHQLTGAPMRDYKACSLCTVPELLRAVNDTVHYVAWPPAVRAHFPFVESTPPQLDPTISLPGNEPMIGIVPLNPLVALANVLALLLLPLRASLDPTTRTGLRILAASWLALLALSTCWYVIARYSLDFMLLMGLASAILVESGFTHLAARGISLRLLRITSVAFAILSIVAGVLLGFQGAKVV